jgi:SAM-dependent methyltransferase
LPTRSRQGVCRVFAGNHASNLPCAALLAPACCCPACVCVTLVLLVSLAECASGDNNLRSSYGQCALKLLQGMPGAPNPADVQSVLDVGCATGLSSLALRELFPAAHITGVDLSPHMVAVGRYHQQQREVCRQLHGLSST